MTRYVLATDDDRFARRVEAAAGRAPGHVVRLGTHVLRTARSGAEATVGDLVGDDAGVLILGADVDRDAALELAARLDAARPHIAVLLVAGPEPDLLPRAMHAGVRDVLDPDADMASLADVLQRGASAAERRRERLSSTRAGSERRGRVLTVLSPKGGSGKTTIATNLGAAMAAATPGQVVLVDADTQFGDVSGALSLMAEHGLEEATGAVPIEPMTLKALLTSHETGLLVLPAPDSPAAGERIDPDRLLQVIGILAEEFSYVVIDTAAGLPEHNLSLIETSSDVIVVASMDVPSIKQVRKLLDALDAVGLTGAARHLVLNRADSRVGLDVGDVETAIGLTAAAAVPSTRDVPLSTNQGVPLVVTQPRSQFGRVLTQLAGRFAPEAADRARRSRFGRRA